MLFIPILLSLGAVRLAVSILVSEEKNGLPPTTKRFASGLSLALAGIGTLLLATSYQDEDAYKFMNLLRAQCASMFFAIYAQLPPILTDLRRLTALDELIKLLSTSGPLGPGLSRSLAFCFFLKAILMGSDVFRRCDIIEGIRPALSDFMALLCADGEDVPPYEREKVATALEDITVTASESDSTVIESSPNKRPTVGIIVQALSSSRATETGAQSTIVIHLKSSSGVGIHPTVLAGLDTLVRETLSTLIPATLRAIAPTQHPLVSSESTLKRRTSMPAETGCRQDGFAYIDDDEQEI